MIHFNHVDLTLIDLEAVMVDNVRYYQTPEGKKYPSVTSVISKNPEKCASIAKWRKRVGNEKATAISTRASTRGTAFHSIVEDYLNNELDESKYEAKPLPLMMFRSAKPVLNRINNIHILEGSLYSDRLRIAGRVDCIAEFDGELAIIDFKTSTEPKKESWIQDYFVQEIAYGWMFFERYNMEVQKFVTIIACENGETQVFEIFDKKTYYEKLNEYINYFFSTQTNV